MMKYLIQITLCAALTLSGLSPALATPPRYASISDTAIAANASHIFLLRLVSDNEGSHYIRATTRFLVSQNVKSGALDQLWLLDTTRQNFVEVDQHDVDYHRASPKIDILDILAQFNATPLSPGSASDWTGSRIELTNDLELSADGILDLRNDQQTLILPTPDILSRISASLNPLMGAMTDDPGPVNPITFDATAYTKDLADCFVQEVAAHVAGHALVRLECENGDFEVLSYGIYLTVPDP